MIVFDQLKKSDPHLRAVTLGVLIGMVVLVAGLWWVQIISCGSARFKRSSPPPN